MPRPLRVFLCHASQDKPAVWKLHRYLTQHGVKPWLDQADLLPGEDWEVEIPNTIFSSDVILVCLSKNSVDKEGYVQKEISFALDKALEKPGKIFIIPIKLEECDIPKRLSRYQWVDLSRTDGRKRLLMGLNKRVTELGDEVTPVVLEDTRQRKPVSQPIVSADHDAVEHIKANLEKTPRESTERLAQEAKEKSERKAAEKVKQEKAEQAKAQLPAGRVSSPTYKDVAAVLLRGLRRQEGRKIIIWGGGLLAFAILSLVTWKMSQLPAEPEVTQTPSVTKAPFVAPSTPTKTPIPATTTATIFPTPPLGIGSTMTSEKDGMTLVYVPEGEFIMGSVSYPDAQPVHRVFLDGYWLDQTEVTNAMYARCVDAGQCNPGSENDNDSTNYPVTSVSWYDAIDYCKYVGRRLPTEAEWEKAARGENGYTYPWGNIDPQGYLLNYNGNDGIYNDVGSYPAGASVYGALDMAGSVSEWVGSLYAPYPYDAGDGREDLSSFEDRVMRGSSTMSINRDIPSALRGGEGGDPTLSNFILGFRCASSP